MSEQAYPLSWPVGWKRTRWANPSRFDRKRTVNAASAEVLHQLGLLDASQVVISTNVQLRLDGLPRSGQRNPEDPGAAVYFRLAGEPHSLACDSWDRVQCNLWAIAKHVEALRGMDRWGVGDAKRAFTGYHALPENTSANGRHWREVLGLEEIADVTPWGVQNAWRRLCRDLDQTEGADQSRALELNLAKDQALGDLQ